MNAQDEAFINALAKVTAIGSVLFLLALWTVLCVEARFSMPIGDAVMALVR